MSDKIKVRILPYIATDAKKYYMVASVKTGNVLTTGNVFCSTAGTIKRFECYADAVQHMANIPQLCRGYEVVK